MSQVDKIVVPFKNSFRRYLEPLLDQLCTSGDRDRFSVMGDSPVT